MKIPFLLTTALFFFLLLLRNNAKQSQSICISVCMAQENKEEKFLFFQAVA